jgi:hypothetical protein
MFISDIPISETASSGAWSFNTGNLVSCYLKQIVVKAATATTTFGLRITDPKNNIVYESQTPATGTLREEVEIPLKGINTIAVFSSSADEAFTGKLVLSEF